MVWYGTVRYVALLLSGHDSLKSQGLSLPSPLTG